MEHIVRAERIENKILQIRGKKVMLDRDLAELYGVKPIRLREQVKRNRDRFPEDFIFRLSREEARILVSHFAIPSKRHLGGYLPYVFTEQGVAMLSSVLNSKRAVYVNIQIMRAFINLRRASFTYTRLRRKIDKMERRYDAQFRIVFEAIKKLLEPPPEKPKPKIGFHP